MTKSKPFPIPQDVREWLRGVFSRTNSSLAQKISHIPTLHETSLDLSLIESLSRVTAPVRTPSNWTIRLDTHYLGGMRHWGSWEIADVGLLLLLRHAGRVVRSKIGLFQSKRLYPLEQDYEEDKAIDYLIGFGRLWESDEQFLRAAAPRAFRFTQKCRYKALIVEDDQYKAIRNYESKYKIPVCYLLYHPLRIPSRQTFPVSTKPKRRGANRVGTRVVPASDLRSALDTRGNGYVPSYGDLRFLLPPPFDQGNAEVGWRLEAFIDELIHCRTGYESGHQPDEGVEMVFARRNAPISAAISVTIDAPEGAV